MFKRVFMVQYDNLIQGILNLDISGFEDSLDAFEKPVDQGPRAHCFSPKF